MSIIALVILLALAVAYDLCTRRIPNSLIVVGLGVGLALQGWHGGWTGMLWSLCGVGVACLILPAYAVGGVGAGDVKLLGAVGALLGPLFLLWALLGTVLAGGLMALFRAAARGVLRETIENTLRGLPLFGTRQGVSALAATSMAGRMPFAPAIAFGAAFAFVRLHLSIFP